MVRVLRITAGVCLPAGIVFAVNNLPSPEIDKETARERAVCLNDGTLTKAECKRLYPAPKPPAEVYFVAGFAIVLGLISAILLVGLASLLQSIQAIERYSRGIFHNTKDGKPGP